MSDTHHKNDMASVTPAQIVDSFDGSYGSHEILSNIGLASPIPAAAAYTPRFTDSQIFKFKDLPPEVAMRLRKMLVPSRNKGIPSVSLPKWPPAFKEWPQIEDNKC